MIKVISLFRLLICMIDVLVSSNVLLTISSSNMFPVLTGWKRELEIELFDNEVLAFVQGAAYHDL